MNDPDPTWEAPPSVNVTRGPQSREGKWSRILAPLRERPGEWARFDGIANGTGTDIKLGRFKDIAPGEFEATMRFPDKTQGQRRGVLYVRYIGEPCK